MPDDAPKDMEIYCPDQASTERVAAALALSAKAGDIFALTGDLGAGKSTFARAFIRKFMGNPNAEVPSPTFTLVQSYEAACTLYHTDLYRLSGPEDVYDLGLDDELSEAIFLVEWPERMPAPWWQNALEIRLEREGKISDGGDEARRLVFAGNRPRWQALLQGLL